MPSRPVRSLQDADGVARSRFQSYSRMVLLVTLGVIVFGAYVRASGSGAGCGSHWPTCNGEVIPRAKSIATVIEFTHRATSGLISLLIGTQLVWALRVFPRGHRARRAAWCSAGFLVSEALVGAGLVVFQLVAKDASLARAAWICAHLLNTFLLLASLTLTGLWTGDRSGGARLRPPRVLGLVALGLVGLVLVGASGAVTALGDTLFPARNLAAGIASDFSARAHLFERLRVVHPTFAVLTGGFLLYVVSVVRGAAPQVAREARWVAWLVYLQLGLGVVNLWLLAPVIVQLLHLLVADLLFVALVTLGARSLDVGSAASPSSSAPLGNSARPHVRDVSSAVEPL